jgi:ABC-type phosphate transport system, ATPase component
MSIYDNVAFGPKLLGLKDKTKLNFLVEKYLRLAGLWEEVKNRLDDPANRLSIGQQQRLLSLATRIWPLSLKSSWEMKAYLSP